VFLVERVKTRIPGLDEILNGSILKRDIVLLSRGTRTRKSIFSHQYLWISLQMKELSIFMTLEEYCAG